MPRKTLLAICQDAVNSVKDINTPTTIINNSAPEAVLLKSMATKVARELERGFSWQTLKREHTFVTDGGADYALPSDYRRLAPLSFWDRTGARALIGAGTAGFQGLRSGIIISGTHYYFSVYGDMFRLSPTPASGLTLAYNYFSHQFVETSDADDTPLDDWTADTNICRLDGDLMTLGVTYRYLLRMGAPCGEEKADFIQAIKDLQADDTPAPLIDTGSEPAALPYGNIPDGNWNLT